MCVVVKADYNAGVIFTLDNYHICDYPYGCLSVISYRKQGGADFSMNYQSCRWHWYLILLIAVCACHNPHFLVKRWSGTSLKASSPKHMPIQALKIQEVYLRPHFNTWNFLLVFAIICCIQAIFHGLQDREQLFPPSSSSSPIIQRHLAIRNTYFLKILPHLEIPPPLKFRHMFLPIHLW